MASFWIAVPLPQGLTIKLTISLLLKNKIDSVFFSEYKLFEIEEQKDFLKSVIFWYMELAQEEIYEIYDKRVISYENR